MPIDTISEFFGVDVIGGKEPSGVHFDWCYDGPALKYQINLDTKARIFSISADVIAPFGFQSLLEVSCCFDSIGIETEPKFYGDRKILVVCRNYPEESNFKELMIIKWDQGELSIWPNNYPVTRATLDTYFNKSEQ